ncbi:hypothetical protein AB0I28_28760 [Phytomonospora sp. NPDC050363]|uniref:hypothetical protein n=1 Tax=Phytomonospora sp. NPDC050363 TaxID=3155642 RepID=UPI0033FCA0A9
MIRRSLAALCSLLVLAGCGASSLGGYEPAAPDGWAVLDEGTEIYVRLGHIRWELERECMEDKGFDVHPALDEAELAAWRPVDRAAPILAPSVEEARQNGLDSLLPGKLPPTKPDPAAGGEFAEQDQDYRDRYYRYYYGEVDTPEASGEAAIDPDSCTARVHHEMFGETAQPGGWQPMPVPATIDETASWEMYYAIPAVVTAAESWRTCVKKDGYPSFETLGEARERAAATTGEAKRRELAVTVATCVDASGWREVHTASWETAVDRLVTEQLPQIRSWRADLAGILDNAETLVGE